MKLLIYIILFIMLIYLNNTSSSCPLAKENFTDTNNIIYDGVNPYDLINRNISNYFTTQKAGENIIAYNNSNLNWVLSNSDYSDIYNGYDNGGDEIFSTLNWPKPKTLLDKTMLNLKNKTTSTPINEIHKQSIITSELPEIQEVLTKKKYPTQIKKNNLEFNLLGFVYNTSYRQYYLLYETINRQINTNIVFKEKLDNLDAQVFTYLLVQMENVKPIIKFIFGPRSKININDTVYFSQGPLQLGPLTVAQL